jgi:fructose-1-phosphate kinase PfkB-like protein
MSEPPHVFTLTGNLLAERTFHHGSWEPGRTQRAHRESFQVGGKGINVSKMLNRLGSANTARCFTGGAAGAECESWLSARAFSFRAFATDRNSRTGLVVRGENHPETTFLGPDVVPSAEAVKACADFLDAQADNQILGVCGSIPGWREPHFDPLRAALQRWLQRGILVADTYGPPLIWLSEQPLALAKINAVEFKTLDPSGASIAASLSQQPSRWKPLRWVISDGAEAVLFQDGPATPVETVLPPHVQEISPTGSGDVLFAALIYAMFLKKHSLRKSLSWALPLAAANAAHAGVAEFPDSISPLD